MRRLGFKRDSLMGSLVLTIGTIVLLTTIAVSIAGYYSARSTIERQFREQTSALSRQAMAQQDAYLAARMEELRQLVFSELQESRLNVQAENKILWNYARAFGSSRYADLSIVDLDGKVVASTGSPQIDPGAQWLATVRAATRPGVISFTRFKDQSEPELIVFAPLISVDVSAGAGASSAHRGTLVGRLPATEMIALLRSVPVDPHTSLFLLHGKASMGEIRGTDAPTLKDAPKAVSGTAIQQESASKVGLSMMAAISSAAADAPVRDLAIRSGIVGLVVFFLATLAAVWTARRIAAPLGSVMSAAHEFTRGNLASTVDVSRLKLVELRDLGSSFNSLAQALRSLIEGIDGSSKTIFSSVRKNLEHAISVNTGTEEQATASAQITVALSQAGAGARQVGNDCVELEASSRGGLQKIDTLVNIVDATNVSLGQLSETIDRSNDAGRALAEQAMAVAQRARSVGELAERSSFSASEGGAAVRALIADIQAVGASLLDTVERLEHLADASGKAIQAQVGVIGDMAERSKLLALNAGIEAARAGESGRGFSVIAGELHRLASGSKSAGDEVKSLVGKVVAETQSLVVQAQSASSVARGAIDRANSTGTTIDHLVSQISANAEGAREIRAIAEEQARRTSDIENATAEMRTRAAQTAQAARTVSELSRQVRGAVEFATNVATQVSLATGQQVETFAVIEQNATDIERATASAASSAQASLDATHRLQQEVELLVSLVAGFSNKEPGSAPARAALRASGRDNHRSADNGSHRNGKRTVPELMRSGAA